MFLQKPDKLYQEVTPEEPAVVEDVIDDINDPIDIDAFVEQLSPSDLIKLHKKLLDKLYSTVGTTTPAILQEPIPEYKSVEPVQQVEPAKEPMQTPALVHWGKPDGWDRPTPRMPFLKALWCGLLDKDMDLDDYKRYDKFMTWFRPVLITIVLVVGSFLGYRLYTTTDNRSKNNSFIDDVIEWASDQYHKLGSPSEPDSEFKTIPITVDTQKLIMETFHRYSDSVATKDTTITVPLIDSSLILIDR